MLAALTDRNHLGMISKRSMSSMPPRWRCGTRGHSRHLRSRNVRTIVVVATGFSSMIQ